MSDPPAVIVQVLVPGSKDWLPASAGLPMSAHVHGLGQAEGVPKMNRSAAVEVLAPAGVVPFTPTVPATAAGEVAVIEVAELNTKPAAATVPNVTPLTPVKLVPVMVTEVPPAVGPEFGLSPVKVGPGAV